MNPEPTSVVDRADVRLTEHAPPPSPPGPRVAAPPEDDNGSLTMLLAFVGLLLALGVFRSWWIPGIVAGLLFMLFMHELGHYVTARISGMKVTEFFLGFGPKIWSFQRGETEYGVKAIPAGAYVRIMGMTNLDDIDPAEEHRTYRAQPYWQRMMTICAGSAMHFLMAILSALVLFGAYDYQGFNGPPWVVREVVPGSTADTIGVAEGDSIVEINGEQFATWPEFGAIVQELGVEPVEVVVDRDDERVVLSGTMGARSGDVVGAGFGLVINEDVDNQGWRVESVRPGSGADAFGFLEGDAVVAFEATDQPSQAALARLLVATEGGPAEITVDRSGSELLLVGEVALDRSFEFRGFFGIGPRSIPEESKGWIGSIPLAIDDFGTVSRTNVEGLVDLLNPSNLAGLISGNDEPARAVPPPAGVPAPTADDDGGRAVSIIGVARLFAASESAAEVFFLFMIVNSFIGIFNLVPLLPLDGGHAAIATYERARELVTRKPHRVDAAKLVPVTWLVVIALVGFGLWAAALDIFSWPA